MAPGLTSLALCITTLVGTVAPYIAARADQDSFISWFVELTMAQQALTWALARLCSFPTMALLRAPVAANLPIVGSMLVCFIGEALGTAVQFQTLQAALGPTLGLRGSKAIAPIREAFDSLVFPFMTLCHLSHVGYYAPWVVALGVPCIAQSWDVMEVVAGVTVAQSVLMAFTVLTVRISSSAPFIWNTLVPAMQWCADLFVVYWLWQQQRALETQREEACGEEAVHSEPASEPASRTLRFKESPPLSPLALASQPMVTRSGRVRPSVGVPGLTPEAVAHAHGDISLDSVRKRLETTLTDAVYDTPTASRRRSTRLATRG